MSILSKHNQFYMMELIVPEKVIIVDETTYNGLVATEKREVSNYTYEERLNESKRTIKILTF
jgi:hypothetical protein